MCGYGADIGQFSDLPGEGFDHVREIVDSDADDADPLLPIRDPHAAQDGIRAAALDTLICSAMTPIAATRNAMAFLLSTENAGKPVPNSSGSVASNQRPFPQFTANLKDASAMHLFVDYLRRPPFGHQVSQIQRPLIS